MSHVVASSVYKKHALQLNFLERVFNFFYHIFGALFSFTSETIYCHLLVIFKSVAQMDNPLDM